MISLTQQIETAFKHCAYQKDFESSTVLVISEDGQVLNQLGLTLSDATVSQSGVLMAGAWQASITLLENKDDNILSLGDSKSGLFIIPFTHDHSLLMGIIYKEHLKPGLLKMKTKMLRNFLSENISNKTIKNDVKNDYLFKNITDEELDRLFSFAGI